METTPEEVQEALKAGTIKLIDVRGQDEWDAARIDGATLITKELVDEISSSWEKDTAIVFHCHSGVRSLQAAHHFAQQGFTNVKSMSGGIDAWSTRIDADVPRY